MRYDTVYKSDAWIAADCALELIMARTMRKINDILLQPVIGKHGLNFTLTDCLHTTVARYNQPARVIDFEKERGQDHEEPAPSILDPHVLEELKVRSAVESSTLPHNMKSEEPTMKPVKLRKPKDPPISEEVELPGPKAPS